MKTERKVYMEDVRSAALAAIDNLVHHGALDYNDQTTDKLYYAIYDVIQKHFDYPDYANWG